MHASKEIFLLKKWDFSDVTIEGDSRTIIKKLQNHGNDRSIFKGVINEIIAM
ncbi:hypothetical protein Gogos_002107 [Gossypium gossypioides]|uniref:RNase H type-1 domain-containing protein n=1 Tax=Gossypium gossypioides TaxID=34282 RepID=A0A7J9CQE6_GOSGO|nr:hypothetical protein [Gossypium gossypioides]